MSVPMLLLVLTMFCFKSSNVVAAGVRNKVQRERLVSCDQLSRTHTRGGQCDAQLLIITILQRSEMGLKEDTGLTAVY
jgi:hypothetical protein